MKTIKFNLLDEYKNTIETALGISLNQLNENQISNVINYLLGYCEILSNPNKLQLKNELNFFMNNYERDMS